MKMRADYAEKNKREKDGGSGRRNCENRDEELTAQRAENLREMIRELEIRHRGRPIGHVTASGGIAGFPEQGRTGESLLRAAEAALQRARQEGGDRISAAQ